MFFGNVLFLSSCSDYEKLKSIESLERSWLRMVDQSTSTPGFTPAFSAARLHVMQLCGVRKCLKTGEGDTGLACVAFSESPCFHFLQGNFKVLQFAIFHLGKLRT